MAKQRRTDPGAWDRFLLWVDANQKVFWVMLLTVISFTFAFPQIGKFFSPSRSGRVVAEVFGSSFTNLDADNLHREIVSVRRLARIAFSSPSGTPSLTLGGDLTPLRFRVYLEEARRLGLRVSDAELGERRRQAWRAVVSGERARDQLEAQNIDLTAPQNRYQVYFKQQEIFQKLEESGEFDPADWMRRVRTQARMNPTVFEEALRNVLLVGKLDAYIKSTVGVTAEEVYEAFVKERQRRRLTWYPIEKTEELEAAVAASLSDQEIEDYFRLKQESFRRPVAIDAEYLVVPTEHFRAEADEAATDAQLLNHYQVRRSDYRRSVIRSDEAAFQLLSVEEKEARDREVYRPFEEVKEEVRADYVAEEAKRRVREAARLLADRLFPKEVKPGERAPSFEDLAKEFPYLIHGRVEAAAKEEAEAAFGKAYLARIVDAWYRSADRAPDYDLTEAQRKDLKRSQILADDAGYAFYARVQVIDPHEPELAEVKDEVRERLAKERALDLVAKAAEELKTGLDGGERSYEDLAGSELEVTVSEGEKAVSRKVRIGEPQSTLGYVRNVSGQIKVPAPEDGESEKALSSPAAGDEPEKLVVHDADVAIRKAGFAIEEAGQCDVARDDDHGACYIVRFDANVKPDPAEFDSQRRWIEQRLLSERQEAYFNEWRRDLDTRAFGRPLDEPKEPAGDSPRGPDTSGKGGDAA